MKRDSSDIFPLLGPRLRLEVLRPEALTPSYLTWLNDPAVNRFLESRFAVHTAESLRAYVEAMFRSESNHLLGIYLKDESRHIGNIKLGPVDPHHYFADIGLLIGEKDCWGQGFATEAICLVRDFAFGPLGLRRLTAGCYGTNQGSERAFLKAGFKREGNRAGHYRDGDQWVDSVLLGMTNPALL